MTPGRATMAKLWRSTAYATSCDAIGEVGPAADAAVPHGGGMQYGGACRSGGRERADDSAGPGAAGGGAGGAADGGGREVRDSRLLCAASGELHAAGGAGVAAGGAAVLPAKR